MSSYYCSLGGGLTVRTVRVWLSSTWLTIACRWLVGAGQRWLVCRGLFAWLYHLRLHLGLLWNIAIWVVGCRIAKVARLLGLRRIAYHTRMTSDHLPSLHRRTIATVGRCGLLTRLPTRTHRRRHSWLLRGLLGWSCRASRGSDLLKELILLKVAAELEIIDALLQSDQVVVQLKVELGSLLQKYRQLLLHDDSLVDVLEELALGGVVASSVDKLVKLGAMLLNLLSDGLLLLLEGLVLLEVLCILGFVALKDFSFLLLALVNLHQLLDGLQLILHGDSLSHDLLLTLADNLKLCESFLDGWNGGVISDLPGGGRLGNHGCQFLTCFRE